MAKFWISEPLRGYNGGPMPGGFIPRSDFGTEFPAAMSGLHRRMREEGVEVERVTVETDHRYGWLLVMHGTR